MFTVSLAAVPSASKDRGSNPPACHRMPPQPSDGTATAAAQRLQQRLRRNGNRARNGRTAQPTGPGLYDRGSSKRRHKPTAKHLALLADPSRPVQSVQQRPDRPVPVAAVSPPEDDERKKKMQKAGVLVCSTAGCSEVHGVTKHVGRTTSDVSLQLPGFVVARQLKGQARSLSFVVHASSCMLRCASFIVHASSCMLHRACFIMHMLS